MAKLRSFPFLTFAVAAVAALEGRRESIFQHNEEWTPEWVVERTRDESDVDEEGRVRHHRELKGGFRLKMECKKDYAWAKEKDRCKSWCATYRNCKSGADIRIRTCGGKWSKYQKWEWDDDVLRPACSSKLCVGGSTLERGSKKLSFRGGVIKKGARCWSMEHQPRFGEPLKFFSCSKAKKVDTDKWSED